ncbi:TerB family tellurite resistance protein [candidate division KSB1 bacterium]
MTEKNELDIAKLNEINAVLEKELSNTKKILDDSLRFKMKMNFSDKEYKKLNNAELAVDFFLASLGGVGGALGATGLWLSSLGIMGQLGVMLGLSTTPVGWIIGGAITGAVTIGGASHYLKKGIHKIKDKNMINIPKFINTPLDALALNIATLLVSIGLKIAYSDKDFNIEENDKIVNTLSNKWGYNVLFLADLLSERERKLSNFTYDEVKALSEEISHLEIADDVKHSFKTNLVTWMNEIMSADGKLLDCEKQEIERLNEALF